MKKFVVFLLAAAMLMQLCACGTDVPDETTAETETAEQTGETRTQHALSNDLDFGGETFSAAFFYEEAAAVNYYVNESSSDKMTAAVYRRAQKAEDFLGIDIKHTADVTGDDYRTLYKSGDDIYQQLFLASFPISYMSEGYLMSLEELPHIDMSAEWWNYEQIKRLQLGKYPYFAVSDFMITEPLCITFNRDMIVDNNLEDPYKLVDEGTWTLDKYIEMAGAVVNDKDGNGLYDDEDDIIGSINFGGYSIALFTGCNQFISEKNEEGKLELTLNTEKTLDIVDKLISLRNHPGSYMDATGKSLKFSTGTVLFKGAYVSWVAEAADCPFSFGVIPMPKYNAEQEEYMCYDSSNLMAVSGTTKNKELVGAALEYLAWDSKNEVFPTYYDVLLKTRYSSDMETRHMLDIIFDSIAYEVGGTFFAMQPGFCELWYIGDQVLFYGLDNFSAFYRSMKAPARQSIETFYTALNAAESIGE